MIKHLLALPLLAVAMASPAFASPKAAPAPAAVAPKADFVKVALDTEKGRIVLALDRGRAPITTANFLAYVDQGLLNGQPFYRAMKLGKGGLIQGGVRVSSKMLPPIAHEPTTKTGIRNVAGTVAMANRGAGTAQCDFFIMTQDAPYFDAQGDKPGFAAFGHVVEGMDVVRAILAAPTSPTKGEGVMKGQMLDPVVVIKKAARVSP